MTVTAMQSTRSPAVAAAHIQSPNSQRVAAKHLPTTTSTQRGRPTAATAVADAATSPSSPVPSSSRPSRHMHEQQPTTSSSGSSSSSSMGHGRRGVHWSVASVRLVCCCVWLALVCDAMAATTGGGYGADAQSLVPLAAAAAVISEQPFFDDISPRNVTSVVDDTVVLKCRVKNKGNRTVSWMRKRDLHILTSNIFTYTGDQRFSVSHPADSDDWDLKIEYAQPRDAGIYECQVNTEPKINLAVNVDITAAGGGVGPSGSGFISGSSINSIGGGGGMDFAKGYFSDHVDAFGRKAARARITGSQEVHVKRGSTISLSCAVNVHAPSVSWFHDQSIVDFDSARGGISLETEKTEQGTSSRLMLTRAALRDSGNYTCVPAGAVSASVQVHVLNGEYPAAMQTSSSGPRPSNIALVLLGILSICAHRLHSVISKHSRTPTVACR